MSFNSPVDLHIDKKDSRPGSLIWWKVENCARMGDHMVFATPEMGTFQRINHGLFVALDSANIAHGTICLQPVPNGAVCEGMALYTNTRFDEWVRHEQFRGVGGFQIVDLSLANVEEGVGPPRRCRRGRGHGRGRGRGHGPERGRGPGRGRGPQRK